MVHIGLNEISSGLKVEELSDKYFSMESGPSVDKLLDLGVSARKLDAKINNFGIKYNNYLICSDIVTNYLVNSNIFYLYLHNKYTVSHSINTCALAIALGYKLKLSSSEITNLGISALLHDVGKLFIPNTLLDKSKILETPEFVQIKKHCIFGSDYIKSLKGNELIANSILDHHENYDGSGYPNRKVGKEIELFGRIIRVADTFDAMSNRRVYHKETDISKVTKLFEEDNGVIFDSEVSTILVNIMKNKKGGNNSVGESIQ